MPDGDIDHVDIMLSEYSSQHRNECIEVICRNEVFLKDIRAFLSGRWLKLHGIKAGFVVPPLYPFVIIVKRITPVLSYPLSTGDFRNHPHGKPLQSIIFIRWLKPRNFCYGLFGLDK